jgi:uncharacterized protein (TIGR00375 family)
VPGHRDYLVLARPRLPRAGLPCRSRTGRRRARWTGPEAAAIFRPRHVLSPLCRTPGRQLPAATRAPAPIWRPGRPRGLRQQLFAGRRRGGTIFPAAGGRHRGDGAGGGPAHRPGVPWPPGRISGHSGLCAHMAWQDRSRLRRPVTIRREEAKQRQCSTPTSTSTQKFSRACSRDCDIPHLAAGALRKGIGVVGTGDFTHPAWADELKSSLVPAEAGLLRLRPDLERDLRRRVPAACEQPVRFTLSVEISTIYRRGERTRKVHHLIYAPTFEAADRITGSLAKIGNLASDGRPILGLDSRDLLEITLQAGPGCYLVPAHIWTPWFAVLGSRSGFDAVADCYDDLAAEIFAVETGLSSDPRMNWMCSSLDGYQLVSNSDAHSPPMLGREATTFATAMDFFSIAAALRSGDGLAGTMEFYPEEGKYHLDGHRKCGIRLEPRQTRERDGLCPECHKPLTVGVLHRVAELADRPDGYRPDGAAGFNNLVPLAEIISEILSVGPKSKGVNAVIDRLVAAFGPELAILRDVPAEELARIGGSPLTETITRLRRGEVIKDAGYHGEYGRIRLFRPGELNHSDALFDVPGQDFAAAAAGPAGYRNGPAGRSQAGNVSGRVDEYQDLDEQQYDLLRLLTGEGHGLTVIGDPDQAIYGFRGACRFRNDHTTGSAAGQVSRMSCGRSAAAGRRRSLCSAPRAAGPAKAGTASPGGCRRRSGGSRRCCPAGPLPRWTFWRQVRCSHRWPAGAGLRPLVAPRRRGAGATASACCRGCSASPSPGRETQRRPRHRTAAVRRRRRARPACRRSR